jgi:hypothetical protein
MNSQDMEDIMWIEIQNKDGLHMFICNAYLGWENTDTAVPRALIRAEIERVYKELQLAHPDAMYMMGGDWNCLGLRRDTALEEWVDDQAEALDFLELSEQTNLIL